MIYSYKKKQNKENIIQIAPNLSPAFQPLVYYQAIISILFDHRVLLDVQLPTQGARLPIMGLLVHIAMSTPITLDFLCTWIWP